MTNLTEPYMIVICLCPGDHRNMQTVSLLQILRIPAIIVICFAVIVAGLVWSILDPTLAPHLQQVK
jgi:hypothetical protein